MPLLEHLVWQSCVQLTTKGTILNTPADVVKTRIQNQDAILKAGEPRKYNWTWPSMATIAKEEGFTALYKGFVPKYV